VGVGELSGIFDDDFFFHCTFLFFFFFFLNSVTFFFDGSGIDLGFWELGENLEKENLKGIENRCSDTKMM